MKPNLFKYSMLTVGIVTAMGITGTANAASVTYDQDDAFFISNVATASYYVDGDTANEQEARSNEVTINVTETGAFSLVATTADGTPGDDVNEDIELTPQVGATVDFNHTLTNDGNVTDTYTIDISNVGGDDFDYDIPNSTISYQKLDANGNSVGSPVTIANGATIELAAGESAQITITALADPNDGRVIGDEGVLSVSATSAYLDNSSAPTTSATNTDNAVTTTPIYAITKSAQSNLNNNRIDLNNANSYVDYTITIENQGTADGTGVTIEDTLPDGLVAIQSDEANYVAPTTTGSSNNQTPSISADGRTVTVTGQDINRGDVITVTFRAKASSTATVDSNFVNYAVVKDDIDDDSDFDLIDSSGDANDPNVIENTYEDPANPDTGADDNSDATVTPAAQTRDINISPGVDKEVPLQSTNNTYIYTISNDGTDITEADAPDEVYFTITPTDDILPIDITTVFVDTNGDGVFNATDDTVLTANTAGQYDLNDAVAAGLAPDESVNIGVLVDTNGSGSNDGGESDIGKLEEFTITVLPQTAVDGTPAPTDNISTTSTTIMQGINLFKYQTAAPCGTNPTSIPDTDWKKDDVNATAGQCAFYKLEATNTFSNTPVTDLNLSDTLADTLTYSDDFVSTTSINSPTAVEGGSGQTITGTFSALAGQEVGNIYFSAKISQTGTNTTP